MGKILEFIPRCSRHSKSMGEGPQCFSKCREEVALASKPATVEPNGVTQALSNGKDTTNAARQARWRKAHPEKHRTTQKARWGRRRAATGKVASR